MGLRDRNPQLIDLSSPAGMNLVRLAAHYAETDLVASFESRRDMPPSNPQFSILLHRDTKTLFSVTAVRKTIITVDRYLEDYAECKAARAAARLQSEAEQARLEAEAEAKAELTRQGIARAEELLTQLAAEDPAFARALERAGADLAAEFARLRDPEQISPVQAQKQIDDQARQVAFNLLHRLFVHKPYSGLDPSRHADAADSLARAQRGESVPPHDPDDEDDDWDDDEDDFDDTGSADVSSAFASVNETAIDITEDAAPLGPRTAPSANAPDDESGDEDWDTPYWDDEAVARRERAAAALKPFNPQTSINNWLRPATPNNQQTTPDDHSSIQVRRPSEPSRPQSAIRNCVVPVCPTLSPRRLESTLFGSRDEHASSEPGQSPITSEPNPVPNPDASPDVYYPPYSPPAAAKTPHRPVSVPPATGPPYGF